MKVQSVDRIFDIMELLSKDAEGLSLTEISHKLELPTSTVFRLVSVLRDRNYVEKKVGSNNYRLGLGLVELTSMFMNSLELKTEAQFFLKSLSQHTGQVVFMGIEQDGDVVYIDKCVPYNDHRKYCAIGTRMALHCTSLGKSLLTAYDDDEIRKIFKTKEMTSLTKNTITDVETLIDATHTSRERQYSVDDEENIEGRFCAASPIYDYRGKIIAAVSVSWVLETSESNNKVRNIEMVKKCASDISFSMGFLNKNPGISF